MTNYLAALKSWFVGGAYYPLVECFEDDIEGLGRGVWEKARSFCKGMWLTDGSRTDTGAGAGVHRRRGTGYLCLSVPLRQQSRWR